MLKQYTQPELLGFPPMSLKGLVRTLTPLSGRPAMDLNATGLSDRSDGSEVEGFLDFPEGTEEHLGETPPIPLGTEEQLAAVIEDDDASEHRTWLHGIRRFQRSMLRWFRSRGSHERREHAKRVAALLDNWPEDRMGNMSARELRSEWERRFEQDSSLEPWLRSLSGEESHSQFVAVPAPWTSHPTEAPASIDEFDGDSAA
jgi:hypothetical protein